MNDARASPFRFSLCDEEDSEDEIHGDTLGGNRSADSESWAAIPLQVNYQGKVTVGGAPFNGNGLFRFTLANRDTRLTLWCNDGSRTGQPASSTPTAAVSLPVINGIFSVRLGDTTYPNMTVLPSTVFDGDRAVLRVWLDDQTRGNRVLSPDRPITSVAYAFHALKADTATTAAYAAGAGSAVRSDRSDRSGQSDFSTTATVALSLAGGGGGGGIPWQEVTAASIQAAANHGYVANSATTVTITLPTSNTLSVGDIIAVSGAGTGGWKIAQNAGQKMRLRGLAILDYSKPWTARESNRDWNGIASSADGTKLVACVYPSGQIYTSLDSGMTWTARESNRAWNSIASSADGTKLIASEWYNRQIHTSWDSGVTWTARESNQNWWDVISSADGTKLIACVQGGQIYTLDAWQQIVPSETTEGTSGSLAGAQYGAVELQYVGGNEFLAICHNSTSGPGGATYQFISSNTATTATVALTALNASHATTADTATTATYATTAGHANTATTATVALNAAGTIHFISSVQILNLGGSSSVTWTDLNVSAEAPGAKGLLLTMRMSDTEAETGDYLLQVRKNGHTWISDAPAVKPYKNGIWSNNLFCIVECDTSQTIEYNLSASGSGTAAADIYLVGYIK